MAREIFTYVLRDMTDPKGGFYSAQDSDSEGKEGLFYVGTPQEVKECIGDELGDLFCRFYNITDAGNFEEGCSIPNTRMSLETFAAREGMAMKKLETALKDARVRLFNTRKNGFIP